MLHSNQTKSTPPCLKDLTSFDSLFSIVHFKNYYMERIWSRLMDILRRQSCLSDHRGSWKILRSLRRKSLLKKPNLIWWVGVRVCVHACVRAFAHGKFLWKHVYSCLLWSMVTKGGSERLLLEFFKNSIFWLFGGHFNVKICPEFEIFEKSEGKFIGRL